MLYFGRLSLLPLRSLLAGAPLQGTLSLSTSSIAASIPAGTGELGLDDPLVTSNTGAGSLAGPVFSVVYNAATGWLRYSIVEDSLGVITVSFFANATSLTVSTQIATVTVNDTYASNTGQTLTITITVTAVAPVIVLTPSLFTETLATNASPVVYPVAITGAVNTPTVGVISGTGASLVSATGITGASAPWTLSITINPSLMAAGSYSTFVEVLSTGADPQLVEFNLNTVATTNAIIGMLNTAEDRVTTVGVAPAALSVAVYSSTPNVPLINLVVTGVTYSGVNTNILNTSIVSGYLDITFNAGAFVAVGRTDAIITLNADNAVAATTLLVIVRSGATPAQAYIAVTPSAIGRSVVTNDPATFDLLTVYNQQQGGIAALGLVTLSFSNAPNWVTASYNDVTGVVTLQYIQFVTPNTYSTVLTATSAAAVNVSTTAQIQVIVANSAPATGFGPVVTLPNTDDVGGTDGAYVAATDALTWVPYVKPIMSGYS